MILLRSLLFYMCLVLITLIVSIIFIPSLLGPRKYAVKVVKLYANLVLKSLKWVVNIDYQVTGAENIPEEQCLVVSKHQSAWETFAFLVIFPDPVLLLKKELLLIPLYGWYASKLRMIPIARSSGRKALKLLLSTVDKDYFPDRQLIVFAEGTRTAPGDAPKYKSGFVALYEHLNIPCVPVALDSGCYWPRRSFLKFPGTITVNILPIIKPNIPRKEFRDTIITKIERSSNNLIQSPKITTFSAQIH